MSECNIDFKNNKKKFSYCKQGTKCSVEECNNPVFCKGYCVKHYAQIQHYGTITTTIFDKNEIVEYDNYAEIIVRNKQGDIKGKAIIDLDDVEKCKRFKWGMYNNGYFYGNINKILRIRLHRYIMNIPAYDGNTIIDHIDRNPSNNRKNNLRIVNHIENNRNKDNHNNDKDVIYEYKHIFLDKRRNLYYGRFEYKGKKYNCGGYKTQFAAHINIENIRKKVMKNEYVY